MENIQTVNEYLEEIDEKIRKDLEQRYPCLHAFYQELRAAFLASSGDSSGEWFHHLRQVLLLDAQLQILLEYLSWGSTDFYEIANEEALVKQIKTDSYYYYRERIGLNASSNIPLGIIYLSEKKTDSIL